MTDRVNSLLVVLEHDMREDDVLVVADAIRQLRGVLNVTANVANYNEWIAETRVRSELRTKIFDLLRDQ